jgi:hypothetical protein
MDQTLMQLDHALDAAVDWRDHVRARPWVMVGAAGVVGFVLGAALKSREGEGQLPHLDDIADALLAVAGSRVTSLIGEVIPGFTEQLARVVERGASG